MKKSVSRTLANTALRPGYPATNTPRLAATQSIYFAAAFQITSIPIFPERRFCAAGHHNDSLFFITYSFFAPNS